MSANFKDILSFLYVLLTLPMHYHRICYQSNTRGATSAAGTVCPCWTPEFTLGDRVHFVQLHVFMFLVPCCDVFCDFCVSNVQFVNNPICFLGGLCLFMVFVHFRHLFTYIVVQHDFHIIVCVV